MNDEREQGDQRSIVVLLGASNLTRAISVVVGTARLILDRWALDFHIASGHGRSYGKWSHVLVRGLPGILQCGIWEALRAAHERSAASSVYALLTDVGNDIMYEQSIADIGHWIEESISRLRELEARITITALPMRRVERLSARQYCTLRGILFPGASLTYDEAMSRARAVDKHIRSLAAEHGLALVEPDASWYGFDPIHIRFQAQRKAWRKILDPWRDADDRAPRTARPSIARWLILRTALPQSCTLFGRRATRRQPSRRLSGGTTVSFF